MALTNFLKKRKQEEKKEDLGTSEVPKRGHFGSAQEKKEKKLVNAEAYWILKGPHITEKAGDLSEKNRYVFRVFKKANKTEIKKAVEGFYKVDVLSIKIINVSEKKRRLGKIQGIRPGYKKAIVEVKKGQKIEIIAR